MDREDSLDVAEDSREVCDEAWVMVHGSVHVVVNNGDLKNCMGVVCKVWVEMDGPGDVTDFEVYDGKGS